MGHRSSGHTSGGDHSSGGHSSGGKITKPPSHTAGSSGGQTISEKYKSIKEDRTTAPKTTIVVKPGTT